MQNTVARLKNGHQQIHTGLQEQELIMVTNQNHQAGMGQRGILAGVNHLLRVQFGNQHTTDNQADLEVEEIALMLFS